jgi:hypothetical protein
MNHCSGEIEMGRSSLLTLVMHASRCLAVAATCRKSVASRRHTWDFIACCALKRRWLGELTHRSICQRVRLASPARLRLAF